MTESKQNLQKLLEAMEVMNEKVFELNRRLEYTEDALQRLIFFIEEQMGSEEVHIIH